MSGGGNNRRYRIANNNNNSQSRNAEEEACARELLELQQQQQQQQFQIKLEDSLVDMNDNGVVTFASSGAFCSKWKIYNRWSNGIDYLQLYLNHNMICQYHQSRFLKQSFGCLMIILKGTL